MCWYLCKRSCWKELTTLLHLRTLFSRLAWKKSLCASLCAQLECSLYFMFLFLGSRVWFSRPTEDILHLPLSTLPPFLSFLCLQQPQGISLADCRMPMEMVHPKRNMNGRRSGRSLWESKQCHSMLLNGPFTECPLTGAAQEPVRCASSVHTHFTMRNSH